MSIPVYISLCQLRATLHVCLLVVGLVNFQESRFLYDIALRFLYGLYQYFVTVVFISTFFSL